MTRRRSKIVKSRGTNQAGNPGDIRLSNDAGKCAGGDT